MSIRIYALAKQLKLDAKALLDLCTRMGIGGKGSALASLSDEEVAQLKVHLSGKGTRAGGPAGGAGAAGTAVSRGPAERGASGALRREDYMAPTGGASKKVPVLERKPERPSVVKPAGIEPAAPEEVLSTAEPTPALPAGDSTPESTPPSIAASMTVEPVGESLIQPTIVVEPETPPASVVEAASSVETVSAGETKPPTAESPVERQQRPDVYQGFRPIERQKPRELGTLRSKAKPPEKKKERDRREKSGPAIKLAPLPAAQRPVTPQQPKEPTPQKPDIKLPLDAIRASKAGSKPLAEHLRKQEQKRKAASGVPPKKAGAKPQHPDEIAPVESAQPAKERRGRRTDVVAEIGEEAGPVLGGREQRQLKRKKLATTGQRRRTATVDDEEQPVVAPPRRLTRLRRSGTSSVTAPRKSHVVITLPCNVRSFAEALGLPVAQVLGKLMELGIISNITAELNSENAELLAVSLGVEADFRQQLDMEDRVLPSLDQEDDPAALEPRPPIVTFLGHVDHGKTSLLDRIIGLDVAAHEKGGITQHIRAYQVEKDGRRITFLDTPGHEAFTAMRARGANVTDVAVLVVAADDGVMPQTQEAISHAKAAGVPIVVALNKIDLPGNRPERVLQELAANELLPSEWGGDTEVVQTSAVTGQGLDQLLETLLTVAELREYRANPNRPAVGTCLESEVQQGRGVVAKVLIQKGTLHVGDIVVCGSAHGRVKAAYDTLNPYKKYQKAGPSMPVNVTGLDVAPGAGDRFYVLDDISKARQIAQDREAKSRRQQAAGAPTHITLETLFDRLGQKDQVQTLNIILRADVRGSIEAIRKELTKLAHPEVQIRILQAMVGGITEADVHLADASDAVIIGFSVVPDEKARILADQLGVQVRRYDIIYQVTEDLRKALEGMLKPEHRETELGRALVQRVFHITRVGSVAGCRVLSGTIHRDARVRLIRENRVIGDYPVESLKREKDDSREVREGYECGIKLGGFSDLKEGDIFEVYKVEEIRRTF